MAKQNEVGNDRPRRGSDRPGFSLGQSLEVPTRHSDVCWEKHQEIKASTIEFSKAKKKYFDDMKRLQAEREACAPDCPRCQMAAKISGKATTEPPPAGV